MVDCFWLGGDPTNPEDFGTAANWRRGVSSGVPQNSDRVIVLPGSRSITDGLDQSTLKLTGFVVQEGYGGTIGTPVDDLDFQMDGDDFYYAGSGVARVKVTVLNPPDQLNPIIPSCGDGTPGVPGLRLTCDKIKTMAILGRGTVAIGTAEGDTTTRMDTLQVSGPATVEVGGGVKNIAGNRPNVTVSHTGAEVSCDCDVETADALYGIYRQRDGLWKKANVHAATAYASGTGQYDDTNVDCGGTVINSENDRSRTFLNVEIQRSGAWLDPVGTGAYTNPVEFPTGMDECTLDFGRKKKLTVASI